MHNLKLSPATFRTLPWVAQAKCVWTTSGHLLQITTRLTCWSVASKRRSQCRDIHYELRIGRSHWVFAALGTSGKGSVPCPVCSPDTAGQSSTAKVLMIV
jgi:hypothetical protein